MKLMNVFNKIERYFEQRRELRAAFSEALQAVKAHDLPRVEALTSSYDFKYHQIRSLLLSSVEQDCVPVFKALLDRYYEGDVNHTISSSFSAGPGGPAHISTIPVLNYALAHRAEAVSCSLLMSPDIDTSKMTKNTMVTYSSSRGGFLNESITESVSALDLAKREKMDKAAALIAQSLKP